MSLCPAADQEVVLTQPPALDCVATRAIYGEGMSDQGGRPGQTPRAPLGGCCRSELFVAHHPQPGQRATSAREESIVRMQPQHLHKTQQRKKEKNGRSRTLKIDFCRAAACEFRSYSFTLQKNSFALTDM